MNDAGNTTLFGLTILIFGAFVFLTSIHNQLIKLQKLKAKQQILICSKKVNGETKLFDKSITKTNKLIRILDKVEYTRVIPIYGKISASAAKAAKKITQFGQEVAKSNFIIKLFNVSKDCQLNYLSFLTPYKQKAFLFARDQEGRTILRKSKWKNTIRHKEFITSLQYTKKSKLKSKSTLYSWAQKERR